MSTLCRASVTLTALLALGGATRAAATELVFVPLPPCRIIDTRCPPGSSCSAFRIVHTSATPYVFKVHGLTTDYSSQGGTAAGCGIPDAVASQNVARAIAVNVIAVGATGSGDLRAWPADQAKPGSSILNFAAVTGLNLANGVILPICADLTNPGCTSGDIGVSADVADAYLVADVAGYFAAEATDVTSVGAGTGLTGGGASGAVSLALAAAYQLPQGCSSGQLPSWNGAGWACTTVTPGTGTITGVSAGTGLTGGGTSGTVSLALQSAYQLPQGCSANQIPGWGGSSWTCTAKTAGTFFTVQSNGTTNPTGAAIQLTSLAGKTTAVIFVSTTLNGATGCVGDSKVVVTHGFDLGGGLGFQWFIEHADGTNIPSNACFNVIVVN